jgi:hypothetical protein
MTLRGYRTRCSTDGKYHHDCSQNDASLLGSAMALIEMVMDRGGASFGMCIEACDELGIVPKGGE